MRATRGVEVAGEYQTGLGLRLGGIDLETAEHKVGRFRNLRRGQAAGDGRETVLQAREKVAAGLRVAATQDVKCGDDDNRDDGDDAAGNHEIVPIVTAHVVPPPAPENSSSVLQTQQFTVAETERRTRRDVVGLASDLVHGEKYFDEDARRGGTRTPHPEPVEGWMQSAFASFGKLRMRFPLPSSGV